MSNLNVLEQIKRTCADEKISAYSIANGINVSISAVRKILNGETKNPNATTIDAIKNYLVNVVNVKYPNSIYSNYANNEPLIVSEVIAQYEPKSYEEKYVALLHEMNKCMRDIYECSIENIKLKNILDKNNIKY